MSEIEIKNLNKLDEYRWFGIKLSQTSKVILFFLALIEVIQGSALWLSITSLINLIQIAGFFSEIVFRQIFSSSTALIILVISSYTLYICIKSKNNNFENQNNPNTSLNVIGWFRFALSQTAAIVLLFLAILGIISVIPLTYSYTYNLRIMIESIINTGLDLYDVINVLGVLYLLSMQGAYLVIYIYTIVKFSKVRKNIER